VARRREALQIYRSEGRLWIAHGNGIAASAWDGVVMTNEQGAVNRDGPRTAGEKLVAAYLDARSLPYSYEPFATGAKPDFVADHPAVGQVVLEVYEPTYLLPRNPDGSFRSGFVASPERLVRRGIQSNRKSRQAAAARDRGIPFVLVITDTNSEMAIGGYMFPGALFGTPQFVWNVGTDADPADPSGLVFGSGGRLQRELNTRFSAVALISRSVRDAAVGRIVAPDEAHPLQIFHNPFAVIPLRSEFAGPHDDQWAAVDSGRRYEQIA
jgi:hypothetical protein